MIGIVTGLALSLAVVSFTPQAQAQAQSRGSGRPTNLEICEAETAHIIFWRVRRAERRKCMARIRYTNPRDRVERRERVGAPPVSAQALARCRADLTAMGLSGATLRQGAEDCARRRGRSRPDPFRSGDAPAP